MQEFPLSKLKIKLKGKDNPTSVFKKRSFLSLNCLHNKSTKPKTPLRLLTEGELPHYILPIKCHLKRTEKNEKNKNKKEKKQKIKLTIFSRNKSDKEIFSKKNLDEKNNNEENNIYNTINFNKSNLNTNYFANPHPINDYSSSNKDNNEKIISELNIINQNNNNINNSFEEPAYNSLISELQKKISEQNILLSSRKKEIEELKTQLENNKNNQIIELTKEKEKEKNEINKLEEEIKTLKNNLENLNNKYQIELENKKDIEQKYKFLKDNMKESHLKEKDINKYEDKIIEQENKIISLQDELNNLKNNTKNKKYKITKESFEIISSKKNINLILPKKNYDDIQLILNVLFDINKIEQNNLLNQINNSILNFSEINKLSIELCTKLNLKEKDNIIMQHFINDFLIKSNLNNNDNNNIELEKLFKYNNMSNNNLMNDYKYKKIIYEKCKKYDYKNKQRIPFYYFKHLYKEICYKNKKEFSSNEFYNLLYECKTQENNICSLYDIFYENLNKENDEIKINFDYELKYPDLVKNFLDKMIKEAYDKKKENFENNQLNHARSFEQDFFEQSILDNKSSNNKINLDD